MAEPAKESDQSMEDILQSIKRIIADEGDSAPSDGGSDVLELTELLAEDAAPPTAATPPEPALAPTTAQDDIDALFNAPAPLAPPVMPPMVVQHAPVVELAPTPVTPAPAANLMSDATLAASVAALNALAHRHEPVAAMHTSLGLRSGITVEDLVVEALKPMLKEWLDGNLPDLVRTLVEREIRRVSGH